MSKWVRINNPNYSPFDGSPACLYVCPNCDYINQADANFCPNCGYGMRDNSAPNPNLTPSWIITAVNLIGAGEFDMLERGNVRAYKVGTGIRIDIHNYTLGGK